MFKNFVPQVLGARNSEVGYVVYATTTPGGFRLSKKTSTLLGINTGDHCMLLTNYGEIQTAIDTRDEAYLKLCEEHGVEVGSFEAQKLMYQEFGAVAIGKGFPQFNSNGTPVTTRVRITTKDKIAHVAENYSEYLEKALADDTNLELKDRLSDASLTDEEKIAILAEFVTPEEVQSFTGSKTASTSKKATGLGNSLNFTDKNTWALLKEDLGENANKFNREYTIDPQEAQTIRLNDGCKEVEVTIYPLGTYVDKAPFVRSKSEKLEGGATSDSEEEEYDEEADMD